MGRVIYANYGRQNLNLCKGGPGKYETCYFPKAVNTMRPRCNNKQSCEVLAGNSVFGDPCPGVVKYLEVYYFCLCDASSRAWSCCSSSNTCGVGEGDCDRNSDCRPGLVCGTNNCRKFVPGAQSMADCCEKPYYRGERGLETDNSGEPSNKEEIGAEEGTDNSTLSV